MSAPAQPLAADLEAGLRRLKLATIRGLAPETLQVAKTQRWAPEELLRTLIEAEIAAREDSNRDSRLKAAGFPVRKTLEEFNLSLSSLPRATFDYLASGWHPLDHNLHCVAGSLEEAERNGDLDRWAHWAAGSEVDYLEPRSA